MTLEQLSAEVGISISQLSRFESGSRRPRADELKSLAERLNVSVAYLIGENPQIVPFQGAFRDASYFFPIRVYYEDTDFSGLVYHANYLRFIERARTEMLRGLDLHQSEIHTGNQTFFVVARMTLEFLRPAKMDDLLTVETKPIKITAATLELDQSVRRGDETLFTARVLIVAVSNGKARRMPREIREKLSPAPAGAAS